MAAIHELSSEALLSQLSLWGVPPTQTSIVRDVITDHRPTALDKKLKQPMYFLIGSGLDEYILLNETYFYLKFKITIKKGKNGDPLTEEDWKTVVPANNLLFSMFESIDVSIGDKAITLSPQNLAYRAYTDVQLGFHSSAKYSHLSAQFWLEDRGTRNARIVPADCTQSESLTLELMGRLPVDLTYQNLALIGGCTLKFRFLPQANPAFFIECDPGLTPGVEASDAIVYVHKAKVSSDLLRAHSLAIAKAPAKYAFTRVEVTHHNAIKNANEIIISNAIVGVLPRRMFVFMVNAAAYNGDVSKNPFYFEHCNVSHMAVYIDGVQYPQHPYTPNFGEKCYAREFLGLYQALDQNGTHSSADIDYSDYADGNTIFAFQFSPDLSNGAGAGGHLSPLQSGAMRICIKLKEGLKHDVNVLLYAEYDSILEIDEMRNVLTNYN